MLSTGFLCGSLNGVTPYLVKMINIDFSPFCFFFFFVSSNVDFNPEYECWAQKSRDEEDKYFDSETPEIVASDHACDEEEDELDVYMKSLKPDATPNELAGTLSTIM
jgi:hypothetical protein